MKMWIARRVQSQIRGIDNTKYEQKVQTIVVNNLTNINMINKMNNHLKPHDIETLPPGTKHTVVLNRLMESHNTQTWQPSL